MQARRSTRVVFGTGPALEKIITLLQDDPSGIGYLSYDHQCFELLGKGLDYLRLCSQHPKDSNGSPAESADHARVVQIFQHLGIDKVINDKFYQQPSPEQRLRLLTDWFDALKTLRFVHRARDFFPDASLLRTLAQLPASYVLGQNSLDLRGFKRHKAEPGYESALGRKPNARSYANAAHRHFYHGNNFY